VVNTRNFGWFYAPATPVEGGETGSKQLFSKKPLALIFHAEAERMEIAGACMINGPLGGLRSPAGRQRREGLSRLSHFSLFRALSSVIKDTDINKICLRGSVQGNA